MRQATSEEQGARSKERGARSEERGARSEEQGAEREASATHRAAMALWEWLAANIVATDHRSVHHVHALHRLSLGASVGAFPRLPHHLGE